MPSFKSVEVLNFQDHKKQLEKIVEVEFVKMWNADRGDPHPIDAATYRIHAEIFPTGDIREIRNAVFHRMNYDNSDDFEWPRSE